MRQLVGTARVGRLVTVAGDQTPHAVPVCYVLRGETAYSAVDHKPKRHSRLRRIANIEQTGRACLLVDDYSEDWSRLWWVRLDATGRVVTDRAEAEQAVTALAAKYPQYRQHRPSGPVLALDITGWRGWAAA
jgi:PPOX class probable F420-dependent enzyme